MPETRHSRKHDHLRRAFRTQCAKHNTPCWICGHPIDYTADPTGPSPDRFHLDHLHPVSTRPDLVNDPANFRPAHAACNQARGNGAPHPGIGAPSRAWT